MSLPRYCPRFIALLALVLALAGAPRPASAETFRMPKEKPVFVIDLPDDWKHERVEKDGSLKGEPREQGDGFYALQVFAMPTVHSKAEMQSQLPGMAKTFTAKSISHLVLGEVEENKNGNGVPFTGLRADGKDKGSGDDCLILLHAFEPQKGKWYIIIVLATTKSYDAHHDEYDAVTASVQAIQ